MHNLLIKLKGGVDIVYLSIAPKCLNKPEFLHGFDKKKAKIYTLVAVFQHFSFPKKKPVVISCIKVQNST